MKPTRVYIADEHNTVRAALVDRLKRAADIDVVGHHGAAAEILQGIQEQGPDVVLIEIKRSDGMGLEILRQISKLHPSPCVIVLTSYESEWEQEAATRAGAHLYVLKEIDSGELIRHIHDLVEP